VTTGLDLKYTNAVDIAQSPLAETKMTLGQAGKLVAAAMGQTGGFDVPCNVSVPFIAVPGLIMQTVKGTVYPKSFSVAVQTMLITQTVKGAAYPKRSSVAVQTMAPPADMEEAVSAITKFSDVTNSGPGVKIEILGFPQQPSGNSSARRGTECMPGMEWRYARMDAPPGEACKCAPNVLCSGATSCSIEPRNEDSWLVIMVNKSLCAAIANATLKSQAVPGHGFAVSIGLGLGLGLLFTSFLGGLAYFVLARKTAKEVPLPPHRSEVLVIESELYQSSAEVVFVKECSLQSEAVLPTQDVQYSATV
jgi:hypothetical protein